LAWQLISEAGAYYALYALKHGKNEKVRTKA
jgi:hypothetical protein